MAGSRIIPILRYEDAPAAIEWLCEAFGFERHLVVQHEGVVAHAQLRLADDMIMLGSVRKDHLGQWLGTVREMEGKNTMSSYLVVDDVDAHHDRARSAGAEIVYEPTDQDYGGRLYSCLDPEGNLWHFGSYDPWPAEPAAEHG
jgi:uncharacterized glyoxalase superfamily protein PhnB